MSLGTYQVKTTWETISPTSKGTPANPQLMPARNQVDYQYTFSSLSVPPNPQFNPTEHLWKVIYTSLNMFYGFHSSSYSKVYPTTCCCIPEYNLRKHLLLSQGLLLQGQHQAEVEPTCSPWFLRYIMSTILSPALQQATQMTFSFLTLTPNPIPNSHPQFFRRTLIVAFNASYLQIPQISPFHISSTKFLCVPDTNLVRQHLLTQG